MKTSSHAQNEPVQRRKKEYRNHQARERALTKRGKNDVRDHRERKTHDNKIKNQREVSKRGRQTEQRSQDRKTKLHDEEKISHKQPLFLIPSAFHCNGFPFLVSLEAVKVAISFSQHTNVRSVGLNAGNNGRHRLHRVALLAVSGEPQDNKDAAGDHE